MAEISEPQAGPGALAAAVSATSAALAAAWQATLASLTSWPRVAGLAVLVVAGLFYMGKISAPAGLFGVDAAELAAVRAEMTQGQKIVAAQTARMGALRLEIDDIQERLESLEAARVAVKKPIAARKVTKPVTTD